MVPTDHESDDLLVNPAPRCPCVLVLDTSGSMSGDPITELNAGLKQFLQEVEKDETAAWSVELAILTAGGQVDQVLPFTVANQVIVSAEFKANGGVP
ncbi:hypothetical protein FACS189497_14910 [Betaproteobacteria bacterium]|nr:hypothetical protein FACS189497_14910 [Betaproteobacteria bacterium]